MKTDRLKSEIAWEIAWKLYGLPYKWGGDDPMEGFDCSGLVVEILQSVGIIPHKSDFTAGGLLEYLCDKGNELILLRAGGEKKIVRPGTIVFYGPDLNFQSITHVEMILEAQSGARFCDFDEVFVIGAIGGGSDTIDESVASRRNAFIKIRPFGYRHDFQCAIWPFGDDS